MPCFPRIARLARGLQPAAVCALLLATQPVAAAAAGVDDAAPLTFSGSVRARYEHLDGDFRPAPGGNDEILALRSDLRADLRRGPLTGALEVIDGRVALDDVPAGTGYVNALEPVNAWLAWTTDLGDEVSARLRVGRLTQDLGGRRLLARHRFRNTVYVFDGADLLLRHGSDRLRALFYLPVRPEPSTAAGIDDARVRLDESNSERSIAALYATHRRTDGDQLEAYLFLLNETDSAEVATRNRTLWTLGGRWLRAPAAGRTDFEVEIALQTGSVRATSAASDTRNLDHRAGMAHLEIGRSLRTAWSPRLSLAFDGATGDHDPTDGNDEGFDALYGVSASDLGPTGLYNAYRRNNLAALVLSLDAHPAAGVDTTLTVRRARLAERRGPWAAAGLRDPSGTSGTDLMTQIEGRLRWHTVPDRLLLEGGVSQLFKGDFARNAPGSPGGAPVTYTWLAATLSF